MISTEQYKAIISDLMDELPEVFFRELTGGVIMSEALVIPDYAQGNDLYTLGQYQVYYGVRQIVMFKGSFDRLYPQADESDAREILRGVLRHEFRHHIELLGRIRNSSSLEAEDARKKQAYLTRPSDESNG
jgi:plasmid stability protein